MKTMPSSIIVRKKNDPTAPRITATPESVDLDMFDVVDEHGNLVSEEMLAAIRKMQAPEPTAETANVPAQHAAQQHTQHNAAAHETTTSKRK